MESGRDGSQRLFPRPSGRMGWRGSALPPQVHGYTKQARAEGRFWTGTVAWMELSGCGTLSIEAFAQGPDLSEGLGKRGHAAPPGGEFIRVLQPL